MARFSLTFINIFSIIFLFIFSVQKASSSPHYSDYACTTDNNYTANSFYKTNLNQLLPSLTSHSSSDTFHNLTSGSEPNKVYGLYYCRGDLTVQDCNDCVKAAAGEIVTRCPVEKEAFVWYDECTLRYSNRSIFALYVEYAPGRISYSLINVSNPGPFLAAVTNFVDQLTQQAVVDDTSTSPKNYAKGKTEVKGGDAQILYCLVQCTPDLNKTQCIGCLQEARSNLVFMVSGSTYARINLASCRIMYDIMPFGPGEVRPPSPSPTTNGSSDTKPDHTSPPPNTGKDAKFYVLVIAAPLAVVALVLGVVLFCFFRRKKEETTSRDIREKHGGNEYQIEGATQFDLVTMKAATNDFSPSNKLGQGGFGIVYKGELQSGHEVAIKRLSEESKQGIKEFINEVQLVVKLQHKNLVRLVGFCTEAEERLVIYEFMPKLSLDYYLFDRSKSKYLSWETRYKIIDGIARGLQYLHEDSRLMVVHRDLKASNILLDEYMNPKIADFGIAKHVVVDQTQGNNTTKIVGTRGYMAPEYAMAGQFSVKSDVFSFGVIILEIISGQSSSQHYQMQKQDGFLLNAWKRWIEGEIDELIDPTIRNTVSRMEVGRCIQIGLLCVQYDAESRPTMHAVLLMLNSTNMQLAAPSAPSPFTQDTRMNTSRHYQGQHTGSEISTTGAWNLEKDLYPR